jgi:hypothetical protein
MHRYPDSRSEPIYGPFAKSDGVVVIRAGRSCWGPVLTGTIAGKSEFSLLADKSLGRRARISGKVCLFCELADALE